MKRGYSLLEIMVALFVLAMLIGLAVPIYTDQVNKSRIASALNTLAGLEQAAKAAYEENPSNSGITYAGQTLTNNTLRTINVPPVINAIYVAPGGNGNVGDNQFLVCVFVGDLNIEGYVAPGTDPSITMGTSTRVCKQVTAADPIYTNMCGALQSSPEDIPTKYLPTGCNCANIWAGTC